MPQQENETQRHIDTVSVAKYTRSLVEIDDVVQLHIERHGEKPPLYRTLHDAYRLFEDIPPHGFEHAQKIVRIALATLIKARHSAGVGTVLRAYESFLEDGDIKRFGERAILAEKQIGAQHNAHLFEQWGFA